MIRVILITSLLIAVIFVSGCATIVTGKYQDISVTSDPPGAKVTVGDGMSITTPGTLKLARNQRCTLIAEYPGEEPQQKKLKRQVQGWFWGNLLLVSCTGCVVDITSGSAFELIPDKVHFDFTDTGIAAANPRPSYLKIYQNITDRIRSACWNELDVKDVEEEFQTTPGPYLAGLLTTSDTINSLIICNSTLNTQN